VKSDIYTREHISLASKTSLYHRSQAIEVSRRVLWLAVVESWFPRLYSLAFVVISSSFRMLLYAHRMRWSIVCTGLAVAASIESNISGKKFFSPKINLYSCYPREPQDNVNFGNVHYERESHRVKKLSLSEDIIGVSLPTVMNIVVDFTPQSQ